MHDLDRTQLEAAEGYEFGSVRSEELGLGGSGELQEAGRFDEYAGEATEHQSPLGEQHEMELAAELLEVSSEEELEQFLGNVFGSVQRAVGRAVRSDSGCPRAAGQSARAPPRFSARFSAWSWKG